MSSPDSLRESQELDSLLQEEFSHKDSHVNGRESSDPTPKFSRPEGGRHRPLTPLRFLRGLVCLTVLVSTAIGMLVFLAPICLLVVRFFSRHYGREIAAFFFGHWLAMWPFFFEEINETEVVFSGDKVPVGERVIVICNHRTEVDWMYIWNLALRKGRIGYVKYVVKSSVRNLPVIGWALHTMEFLLIDRKWEVDEPIINSYLSSFEDPRDPLWLICFPEGTDYTEEKKLASQAFAQSKGLVKLNHVLMPRIKGFFAFVSRLRGSLDAVYDLTIAYKNKTPLFVDNLFGIDPAEVHIHVRRIELKEIPMEEEECSTWLYDAYQRKDELLAAFHKQGSFTTTQGRRSIEEKLSWSQFLLNVSGIIVGTLVMWFLVIFSSIWIKVYFGLSCIYITAVTYVGWKPSGLF